MYVGESVTVLLLLRYVYSPLSRGSLRERGREIETLYMSMIGVASISEVLQILGIDPSSKYCTNVLASTAQLVLHKLE